MRLAGRSVHGVVEGLGCLFVPEVAYPVSVDE